MEIYYGSGPVHQDDIMHRDCVQTGIVPAGCKLGGAIVFKEHTFGRDPCTSICPHENRTGPGGCGGRAYNPAAIYENVREVKRADNDAVEARKALVSQQITWVQQLLAKKQPA
jgi:hypothetical protein